MDFEKKYNEAMLRADEAVQKGGLDKDMFDIIFPPEESEDERIRKAIVELMTVASEAYLIEATGFKKEQFLSYLEKQKEIPMPSSTELIDMWDAEKAVLKEKDFRGDEWRLAYNAFMDGFARGTCVKFEKQKEQDWNKKPCLTCQEYEKGFKQGYLNGCTAGYNKAMKEMEQKEQKPQVFCEAKAYDLGYEQGKKDAKKEQKPAECLKAERDGWYVCIKDFYAGGKKKCSIGELVQAKGGMYMMGREDISEWFRRAYYEEVRDAFGPNTDTNIPEQKPREGWSMKDAHFHSRLLYLMRENDSKEGWEGCYEWLEELPLRIPLQPKPAEWSEEDEKNWNNIWDVLDGQFNISEEARKKACAWLKSLRPQKKED